MQLETFTTFARKLATAITVSRLTNAEEPSYFVQFNELNSSLDLSLCIPITKEKMMRDEIQEDGITDYDESSILPASCEVKLDVEVMLHPVYAIPAPYITRAWMGTGAHIDITRCQEIISSTNQATVSPCPPGEPREHVVKESDARDYKFGTLTMEAHPIKDTPCWSMHICVLNDILNLAVLASESGGRSMGNNVAQSVEDEDEGVEYAAEDDDCDIVDASEGFPHTNTRTETTSTDGIYIPCSVTSKHFGELYFLNWLTVVGPHFGYHMSPSAYKELSKILQES